MKKIELRELKKMQIDILDYVVNFCEKNNIKYWIDCGTLLGAVRHKGYIPWDDDIDVGMLRNDYNKFIKLFNKNNNSNYEVCCYENSKKWYCFFAKVLDKRTILYEPDEKSGIKSSVNIDIFVYDNAPDNNSELKIMFKKRNKYLKLNSIQMSKHFTYNKNKICNVVRYPIWLLFQIFPKSYFVGKGINNCKKFSKVETKRVGNFSAFTKQVCDKNVFNSFIDLEFEGKYYKAPIGYDDWLKSFYGDYMKLPPKEKQVSHHKFVAYYKEGGCSND